MIGKSFYWGTIKLGPRNYIKSAHDNFCMYIKKKFERNDIRFWGIYFFPKVVCQLSVMEDKSMSNITKWKWVYLLEENKTFQKCTLVNVVIQAEQGLWHCTLVRWLQYIQQPKLDQIRQVCQYSSLR